jgi:hypothetical protein
VINDQIGKVFHLSRPQLVVQLLALQSRVVLRCHLGSHVLDTRAACFCAFVRAHALQQVRRATLHVRNLAPNVQATGIVLERQGQVHSTILILRRFTYGFARSARLAPHLLSIVRLTPCDDVISLSLVSLPQQDPRP